MTKDEARRAAAGHGLNKLTDKHLEQFAATLENGKKLAAQLPKDLHWSEEPAHVFRLTKNAEDGK